MAAKSGIGWLDGGSTWQPVVGCRKVSRGCKKCWAETFACTRLRNNPNEHVRCKYSAVTDACGWTGDVFYDETCIQDPIKWRKQRKVFPVSMGDLWYERVDDAIIDKIMGIALATQHTYLFLTKRSERLAGYFGELRIERWAECGCREFADADNAYNTIIENAKTMSNIWLGVTVEDNRALYRIDDLMSIASVPIPVRWASCEPLVEALDTSLIDVAPDWVVAGCERLSGNKAGDISDDAFRALRDFCTANRKPFYLKQKPVNGKCVAEPELDGRKWLEFPR